MKITNNIKKIMKILGILIIMPLATHAYSNNNNNDNDNNQINKLNLQKELNQNINLNDAKKILLMNNKGKIINSYKIKNLNNEDVFIITLKKQNKIQTYLIEKNGEVELIEEFREVF